MSIRLATSLPPSYPEVVAITLARLALGLALLWAIVLPALHGHPPAAAAHEHHTVAHAGADGHDETAGAGAPLVSEAHPHEGAHPPALPVTTLLAGFALILASTLGATTGHDSGRSRAPTPDAPRTDARGSPVARHEVALD